MPSTFREEDINVNIDTEEILIIVKEELDEIPKNPEHEAKPGDRVPCFICHKQIAHTHLKQHLGSHKTQHCDICKLFFESPEALRTHQRQHYGDQYPCPHCQLSFKEAVGFALHSFEHQRTYCCPYCPLRTKGKTQALHHVLRHEGNFTFRCSTCGMGFFNERVFDQHQETHLGVKRYACDLCDKRFAVRRYLTDHQQLNHRRELFGVEDAFQCQCCGREFKFRRSMERHLNSIHGVGESRAVLCPVCGKTIANKRNLAVHLRMHSGEKVFCCELCGKGFTDRKYYKRHVKSSHENNKGEKGGKAGLLLLSTDLSKKERRKRGKLNSVRIKRTGNARSKPSSAKYTPKTKPNLKARAWVCKMCFEEFESRKCLFEHRKLNHDDADSSREDVDDKKFVFDPIHEFYTCGNCSAEFQTMEEVQKHLESHEEKYECEECAESFSGALNFSAHMQQLHRDDKNFPCPMCHHTTNRKSAMLTHIQRMHFRKYDFQCRICGKCFNDATTFKEHENSHLGLKPFVCIVCGREFVYSRYLFAHQIRNHRVRVLDKESTTQCQMCPKMFARQETLSKHVTIKHLTFHEGPHEKKHLCDVCGQGFSRTDKLKIHYRKHTGEKPYACAYCSKSFIKRDYLIMHERIHNGEKPYVCDYCGKCFNQGAPLRIHMRSHTGERPYKCPHCGAGCVSKGALNAHIKSCLNSL